MTITLVECVALKSLQTYILVCTSTKLNPAKDLGTYYSICDHTYQADATDHQLWHPHHQFLFQAFEA